MGYFGTERGPLADSPPDTNLGKDLLGKETPRGWLLGLAAAGVPWRGTWDKRCYFRAERRPVLSPTWSD